MDFTRVIFLVVELLIILEFTHVDSLNLIEMLKQAKRPKTNEVFEKFVLGNGFSARAVAKNPPVLDEADDPVFPAGVGKQEPEYSRVCADIVFANDASCSLANGVNTDQVDLIVAIANRTKISDDDGARVGAFSFGQNVDTETKLDFIPGANRSTVLSGLNKLNRNLDRCRTIPYKAMSMSMSYFQGENDRDDRIFKDVLICLGDGWTSPVRSRKLNRKEAKKLKKANVEILWIKTNAKKERDERKQNKHGGSAEDIEILPIVEDSHKIFQYTKGDNVESVAEQVSSYLASRYLCKR